jgi:hypothetical protein
MEMHAPGEAWPSPIEGHDVSLPRRGCRLEACLQFLPLARFERPRVRDPDGREQKWGFALPRPREAAGSSPRWAGAEMGFRLTPPSRGRGFEPPMGESRNGVSPYSALERPRVRDPAGRERPAEEGGGWGRDPCAVKGKGEARRPVKGKGEARRPVKGKGKGKR